MVFRVTPGQLVSQSIRSAQLHAARLSVYQNQTTTGLKLNKPSDDPAGTKALIGVHAAIERMDTELSNITATRQRLGIANTQMLDAQQILVNVNDIILQARQSVEPTERQTLADEISGLRERLIDLANTRYNGEYLFAGAASNVQPFHVAEDGAVTYAGSEVRGATQVRPTTRIDVLYSGAEVFLSDDRETSSFLGLTGAGPGTGTDSATGYGELRVI